MKKVEKANQDNSVIQRWTIDDLKKKLERDRLKYTHGVKHDAVKRALLIMSDNNIKTKVTKEA